MNDKYLIIGLGNPGKKYSMTRHNLGFMLVSAFANKCGGNFKEEKKLKGNLSKIEIDSKIVYMLLPVTYMNDSGDSVKKCMDFFKIKLQNILVVSDDINLPFGVFRVRESGSCGGHKGLKSIEQHLSNQNYARLRVGVGSNNSEDLSSYVLGKFKSDEKDALFKIINDGVKIMLDWLRRKDD